MLRLAPSSVRDNGEVVEGGVLLPFVAGVPFARALKSACAPKLILRAKGVVGTLRVGPGPSSSSIAFSSIESEPAVETLPRRPLGRPKPGVCMGDVPVRPSVVIDKRRPGTVAVETGAGWAATPVVLEGPEVLLFRPKRAVKVLEVKEARRWLLLPSDWDGLSSDILYTTRL